MTYVSRPAPTHRSGPDRCPGALSLHQAADGLLARVRVPGGFVSAAVLGALADVADRFGDGRLEITSRGNLQLRGIYPAGRDDLATALADCGLLPSTTHERVRNIVASPLSDSLQDVSLQGVSLQGLVDGLDRALCARPGLAQLSGRFLFAFDDGSGDMAQLHPDVCARHVPEGWRVEPAGVLVAACEVIETMLAAAEAFLAERAELGSRAWQVRELPDGAARIATRLGGTPSFVDERPVAHPFGVIGSSMVVTVPLGRPTSTQLRVLAEGLGDDYARVTPWRSIVVPNRPGIRDAVESVGLVVGDSLWNELSACSGAPGCAKSHADVQQDAHTAVAAGLRAPSAQPEGVAVHWSGCPRRCGHPQGTYVDVLATEAGYAVTQR